MLEADAPVALESILCTEELDGRPSRLPDYEKENRALTSLIQGMVNSPNDILQMLADAIRETLDSGSAGVSLLMAARAFTGQLFRGSGSRISVGAPRETSGHLATYSIRIGRCSLRMSHCAIRISFP